MFGEATFIAWVLQCPLSACSVLAVDAKGETPAHWRTEAGKGDRFDLIVVGRDCDGRELSRLMRKLKPGGSHLRMLGQCPMPPPGCVTSSKNFPGAGIFTTVWKPQH